MSVLSLLSELRLAGVQLVVQEGALKVRAPKGVLTAELRERVKAARAELIALLSESSPQDDIASFIGVAADSAVTPLSLAQRKLLFLHEFEPDLPVYNMAFVQSLDGPLNAGVLQAVFAALLQRHGILRSSVTVRDDEPMLVLNAVPESVVEIVDCQGMAAEQLNQRLAELAGQPFELTVKSLLRAWLLKVDENDHRLLVVVHHIVFDAASAKIFFDELLRLYNAGIAERDADLPVLTAQYADYARWQIHCEAGNHYAADLDWWLQELAGAPPVLELPANYARPAEPSHAGGWLARSLPQSTAARLEQFARQASVTRFMVVFAVFSAFLTRISGERDLVIGTPVDGRPHQEFAGVVGFFLNTLAIRCDLSGDPGFSEVLQRTRKHLLAAFEHQQLPFEQLVEALDVERDLSRTPVFQVMFAWRREAELTEMGGDLDASFPQLLGQGLSKFDLTLSVCERGSELEFGFEYSKDLFSAPSIGRLLDRFELFLGEVLADPDQRISGLSLLTQQERRQILVEFNDNLLPLDDVCVHELVEKQVQISPAAPALLAGEVRLSYAELDLRANRLANSLLEAGVAAGSRVAMLAERGLHFPVALLAVLKAGAAYVPLEPSFPEARLAFMLADAAPDVILTERRLVHLIGDSSCKVICLDEFDFSAGAASRPTVAVAPDMPAYVIYTSGSTGQPKGTVLGHRGLVNLLGWQNSQPGLQEAARTLHYAALCFDVTFTELFSTWSTGGCLISIDEELRRDFNALLQFIEAQRIERLFLPCAALHAFADAVNGYAGPELVLQDVIVSGEQLQITPAIRSCFERLASVRLHNQYGPAETHVVTALTLSDDVSSWPALPSIGKPVANTCIYVLDEHLQVVPVDVVGELYIGGAQVGLGYADNQALTDEKFVPDPFANGSSNEAQAKMYRSGDLARYRPDGTLEFAGRTDGQLKLRGYRVEPGEVEVLLTGHTDIELAAVAAQRRQSGELQLVAYMVPVESGSVDKAEVRDWLKQRLPEYMLPAVFIVLDSLPRTPSGKLDRRRLPVPEYDDLTEGYQEPQTATEILLCRLYAEVLELPLVGVQDNFFALGGHSLAAMRLVTRIRDQQHFNLPLKYIFRYPTPAELASVLGSIQAAVSKPNEAADGADNFIV